MTTSVPNVTPLIDLSRRIAELVEIAYGVSKATGDVVPVEQAVKLAREFYETELKPRANAGKLTWAYVNKFEIAIDKAEAIVLKAKEKQRIRTEGK